MPMKRAAGFGLGVGLLLLLLCLVWPRPAHAINLCLLNCTCGVSTSMVSFGSYDALSGNAVTAVGNVQATCTLNVAGVAQLVNYTISLSSGQAGSFAARAMARTGGGTALSYNLYSDAGMTTIWGDGTGGSQQVSGSITVLLLGAGVSANYPVYGRIPATQSVKGGSYTDTITVTMSF